MVLIYFFARTILLEARASASLFLNPFVNPISKKLNHATIELIVSQMPYCIGFTKSIVIGTSMRLIPILNILIKKEYITFFFKLELLLSPLMKNKNMSVLFDKCMLG